MPRAVDPPGLTPPIDQRPEFMETLIDPRTLPQFDFLGWLECDMLRKCFADLLMRLLTIQWVPLGPIGVRAAIAAFAQFVQCITWWAIKVFLNLLELMKRKIPGLDLMAGFLRDTVAKFAIADLVVVYNNFMNAWFSINWLQPLIALPKAFSAIVQLAQGLVRWVLTVIRNILGIDAPGIFELEFLRESWQRFINCWFSIQWLSRGSFRQAWLCIFQLGRDLAEWGIRVFRNLTGIDMRDLLSALEIARLQACFAAWTDAIFDITWLPNPIPGVRTVITATLDMLQCVVDWALAVVFNILKVDVRNALAAFEFGMLRAAFGKFIDTLTGTPWFPDLAGFLRTAMGALVDLGGDLVAWITKVYQNLGAALDKLFNAFELPALRAALGTFIAAIVGINWLSPGSLMQGIGAFVTGSQGVGRWLVTVLQNFTSPHIAAALNTMFGSVNGFIDQIIRYAFGDTQFAGWRRALDALGGFSGAAPWDAIQKLYGMIDSLIGGVLDIDPQRILDIVRNGWDQVAGLVNIGSLTGAVQNLLLGIGDFPSFKSISENPFWFWDSSNPIAPGLGSAQTMCAGIVRALRSIEFPVAAGAPIFAEVSLRWQNVATVIDRPFKLQLIPYIGTTEQAPVTIADIANPGVNSGWTGISGEWTPPPGVTSVRLRLLVEEGALAGTVWWTRAILKRTGGIMQDWITGLGDTIQDTIDTAKGFVDNVVNQIWSVFTGLPLPSIPKNLTELATAIQQNLQNTIDNVNAVINRIWMAFTGQPWPAIPKTVEELRQAIVTNLGNITTTITNIQTTIQSILDQLWAVFTGIAGQVNKSIADLVSSVQTRLTYVQTNGLLNSAALTNIANIPAIAATSVSNIAAAINAQTGLLNLNRLPAINTWGLGRANIGDLGTAITALINAGTAGVMTRRATGNITANANAGAVIHSSFFDRIDSSGGGITATLATSRFTVTTPGMYTCDICYKVPVGFSAIWGIAPVLMKNGAVYQVGGDHISFNYLTVGVTVRWIKSSFDIPLAANDYVSAAYAASNATGSIGNAMTGEPNGQETYFTIQLVNPVVT